MSGGPFRDTLTPLIADAQRQLADLRRQRALLEARLAAVQVDRKAETEVNPTGRQRFVRGLLVGLLVGHAGALAIFVLGL